MEKAIHKLFIKQIKFVLFFIMNWPYPTDILFIVPREKMVGSTTVPLQKFSLTSSLKNAAGAAFFILRKKCPFFRQKSRGPLAEVR